MIRDSPCHIYHSALPLSPSSSWLRKCYEAEITGKVRIPWGLPDQWGTCSRTIFLEGVPESFACCGGAIAVGIGSNVVLLDPITGVRKSVLSGHTDTVLSLSSSLDGRLLLSRSYGCIKLWDVQTGGVIRIFDRKTSHSTTSISISPDGATIALGTSNGAILLWDVQTWKCHFIKTGRDDVVTITFSPIDSQRLLSSSQDGTVCQWNVDGHQIGTSYHGGDGVGGLAYASDGTRFVSWGRTAAIVRDSESGEVVVKVNAPDQRTFNDCCLSPDGRLVACKSGVVIYLWDITISGPRPVGHVEHSHHVTFTTFPSSLISGSRDRSVKFWRGSDILADSIRTGRTAALHGSTSTKSVNLFAEEGIIVTSDSSGVVKTWDLTTCGLKSSFSTPAQGVRDTHLAGGTLIIVWWAEKGGCHIWDVYKGQLLRTFRSILSHPWELKVSGDGSKIFGLNHGSIQAVSVQTGEEAGRVELRNDEGLSLFVRGSKVGIDSQYDRGWDFGGPTVSDLGELSDRPRLDLVNWPVNRGARPCWIEDIVTKRQVFHLPERYTKYGTKVEWDGRFLLLLFLAGEVVLMDFDSVSVCH